MTVLRVVITLYEKSKRFGYLLVKPLLKDDVQTFTLSIPETQTTTVEGGLGWNDRPPATLRCPGCDGRMYQHRGTDAIECTDCYREFDMEEFGKFELLHMNCPKCSTQMEHGQRHPGVMDIPEWATCHNCRYHWEFKHSY